MVAVFYQILVFALVIWLWGNDAFGARSASDKEGKNLRGRARVEKETCKLGLKGKTWASVSELGESVLPSNSDLHWITDLTKPNPLEDSRLLIKVVDSRRGSRKIQETFSVPPFRKMIDGILIKEDLYRITEITETEPGLFAVTLEGGWSGTIRNLEEPVQVKTGSENKSGWSYEQLGFELDISKK